jgi:hypothetical protein
MSAKPILSTNIDNVHESKTIIKPSVFEDNPESITNIPIDNGEYRKINPYIQFVKTILHQKTSTKIISLMMSKTCYLWQQECLECW